MTSLAHSSRSSKAGPLPQQIKDLAFNLSGWAMEDGLANKGAHVVITAGARPSIGETWYSRVIEVGNGPINSDHEVFNSAPEFSPAEIAQPTPTNRRYLVVGYTTRSVHETEHLKINKDYGLTRLKLIGTVRPSNVIAWDKAAPPVMVVVPLPFPVNESISFWALLKPQNGLCKPYRIMEKNIFFRWGYRSLDSNLSRFEERNYAWNKIIIDTVERFVAEAIESLRKRGNTGLVGDGLLVDEDPKTAPLSFSQSARRPLVQRLPRGQVSERHSDKDIRRGDATVGFTDAGFDLHKKIRQSLKAQYKFRLPTNYGASTSASNSTTQDPIKPEQEPIIPEIEKMARELQKVTQDRVEAEKKKLTEAITVREADIASREATINKQKTELDTDKENFERDIEIRADLVAGREKTVKEREDSVQKLEQEQQKLQETLADLKAELNERRAKLLADEKNVQDREAAVEQKQMLLGSKLADVASSLLVMQQGLKRSTEFDDRAEEMAKKQRSDI
ncbi:hypothetical protein BKA64DRAFT_15376 [Cadophora sp. MPI-SDFR-AT-0126]|nr:hypothetical protein BKA64DRAFT_15376 [Leotiomycetes sp. MPI-SDFR-AT-0126]